MTGMPLQKKLRIQPGFKALIINAPEGYIELPGLLLEGFEFVEENGKDLDFVHLFVKDKKELDALIDQAPHSIRHDGLLWISYPKGNSGLETNVNRDSISEHLKPKGIRPVSQVSVNEIWSAMRFRPSEKAGS